MDNLKFSGISFVFDLREFLWNFIERDLGNFLKNIFFDTVCYIVNNRHYANKSVMNYIYKICYKYFIYFVYTFNVLNIEYAVFILFIVIFSNNEMKSYSIFFQYICKSSIWNLSSS